MRTLFCVLALSGAIWQAQGQTASNPNPSNAPGAPTQASLPAPSSRETPNPSAVESGDLSTSSTVPGDRELQTQIQDALSREPTLHNHNVKVTASAEAIELSGSVASGKERLSAGRIAQSYARGKRVLNHIVVSGHSAAPAPSRPEKVNAKRQALPGPAASSHPN